jgi:DNA-binding winged helix-turn-helix (wHTH) protein
MPAPSTAIMRDPDPRAYRFGPFELEVRSGELRKHGVRLRLRQQSVRLLLMLLEHHGEVVLREEIRQRLWPDNTIVEFDPGINTAMQRLREALGDSAEEPRWIETLPGRGYRFIGAVEIVRHAAPAAASAAPPVPADGPVSSRIPLLQIAAAVGLCAIALAGWMRQPASPRNWVFPAAVGGHGFPSPDGSAVLYRTPAGLFVRRMDSMTPVQIYGGPRLTDNPAWSPDGSQALFRTFTGLMRTRVPEGPAVMLWPGVHITRGYTWGGDGTLLVAVIEGGGIGHLYLLRADAGRLQRLEIPQLTGGIFYEPQFLPDGVHFLFTWASYGEDEAGIYLAALRQGKLEGEPRLLRHNLTAGFFANGRLLYVQDDNLYAQSLDTAGGALRAEPVRIIENVFSVLSQRLAFFAVSQSGALTWTPGRSGQVQLTWFDRKGRVLGSAGPLSQPTAAVLSPDQQRLLVTIGDQFAGILGAHQNAYLRLPGVVDALWAPDGGHVIFEHGSRVLERDLAHGSDREVARIEGIGALRALSPDGKVLLYSGLDRRLYSIRLDGSAGTQPELVVADYCERAGFSPDGRWIVYTNYAAAVNRIEILIKPFGSGGVAQQISVDGGLAPVWRGDGQEILYLNGRMIYSVQMRSHGNRVSAGAPAPLFEVRPAGLVADSIPLAVTRDGSRILFAQAREGSPLDVTYAMTTYIMTDWTRRRISP